MFRLLIQEWDGEPCEQADDATLRSAREGTDTRLNLPNAPPGATTLPGRRVGFELEATTSHPGGHVGIRFYLVQAVCLHDQRRKRLVTLYMRQVCQIELGPFCMDVVGKNFRIGHIRLPLYLFCEIKMDVTSLSDNINMA